MSVINILLDTYAFNRGRTLAVLDRIEKLPSPAEALGWRPGPGRAHVAWQLMHIGVTEEIFATQHLAPDQPKSFTELWPRFRGGSTPDDDIPSIEEIRRVLDESRTHLLETLSKFSDDDLGQVPESLKERGWTVRFALDVINWHEGHHQGQAHLTLNLYENRA
jgi:uncharacterized damage-inducible protein DinB